MEAIKICVNGCDAAVTENHPIVAGTAGLPVEFAFDESWSALEKTAVFRSNGKSIDCIGLKTDTVVPWELLKKSGCSLWCGVYGTGADGKLQVPTVWVDLGKILPGADPSGDESADPTLPVWQQLTQDIEKAVDHIIMLENNIIDGVVNPLEGGDPQ